MRIVLVYQHFMVSGVGSTKPYDLARHLRAAGHEVTVLCGRGYLSQGMEVPRGLIRRLDIAGLDVLCLGVDYRQGMGFVRRIASFLAFAVLAMLVTLRLPRYDVLLASSTPLTVGLVGLVSRYLRRIPYVFEIRDLWPEVPRQAGFLNSRTLFALSTFFEEWFYREARSVCAISRKMCDRLIQRGVPAGKVRFVPTGVDLSAFQVGPDEGFRRRNGLGDDFLAVYVGAHGPSDGLLYAVQAAQAIAPDEPIRIVLIGDGVQKAELIDAARRAGVYGRQIVLLPPVPRGQIAGILAACDVMLTLCSSLPGMEYLMPNKFFDYLAAGKPIVVNVRAECADWIARAGCGIFADPDSPADLVRALRELRGDRPRAAEMGRRASRLARQRFDRAALHRQWEQILLAARGTPAGRAVETACESGL